MSAAKVSRRVVARIVAGKLLASPENQQQIMQATAAYLIQNNGVETVDLLINDIAEELFEQAGHLTVEVTTAHELTDEARTRVIEFLQARTEAKVVDLHETVDTDLVGGLVARTPSQELDVSVRRKLRQLTAIA